MFALATRGMTPAERTAWWVAQAEASRHRLDAAYANDRRATGQTHRVYKVHRSKPTPVERWYKQGSIPVSAWGL